MKRNHDYATGERIYVLIFEPHKAPYLKKISNSLTTFRKIVHGNIEFKQYTDEMLAIFNGNAVEPNVFGISGTFMLCRDTGDDFTSLRHTDILDVQTAFIEEIRVH